MRIDIIAVFPEMFEGPFTESIIKRAVNKGLVEIGLHNLRDYSTDKHHNILQRLYSQKSSVQHNSYRIKQFAKVLFFPQFHLINKKNTYLCVIISLTEKVSRLPNRRTKDFTTNN